MCKDEKIVLNYNPPIETFWPKITAVPVNQPVQPEVSLERRELKKKFRETMEGIVFK